jgi:outer membrane protein
MNKTFLFSALAFLLLLNLSTFFFLKSRSEKIVVIDVIKTFNEFEMKKELEARVELKLNEFTARIDSLKSLASMAEQRGDTLRRSAVEQELYNVQQQAQQALEVSNQAINEQVWKRLNPMIDEFGKEKGYRIIIGANGMGSVLYRDDAPDVTALLVSFINQKYETGI